MIRISLLGLALANLILVQPTELCSERQAPFGARTLGLSLLGGVKALVARSKHLPCGVWSHCPRGWPDVVQGAESELPLHGCGCWLPSEPSPSRLVSIFLESRHHPRLTTLVRCLIV